MVLLLIGLAVVAAWVNWETSLQVAAIINAVLAFWSNGVLANYRGDPHGAPSWASGVSMLTALGSVVLLIVALV